MARPTTLTAAPSTITPCLAPPSTRALSTTPSLAAAKKPVKAAPPRKASLLGPGGKPKNDGKSGKKLTKSGRFAEAPRDPKMINMMSHFAVLSPKRIPPPLRMGRNRHLRHWTIHRAWLMFRRRERETRERNLMRQYQSMNNACEELRLTAGPGTRDEGYLYRVAMEKKGVYGLHGVPIEYARAQTETPAKVAWNHDWKR
jgi:large subunit ribosomal protein L40